MEIRNSQYNAPFLDSADPDIHYISLEDQLMERLGLHISHVQLYYKMCWSSISWSSPYRRSTRTIEIFDPLLNTTSFHEVNPGDFSFSPSVSNTENSVLDAEFLDDLYYKHGIKTAGKRVGRYFSVNQYAKGKRK